MLMELFHIFTCLTSSPSWFHSLYQFPSFNAAIHWPSMVVMPFEDQHFSCIYFSGVGGEEKAKGTGCIWEKEATDETTPEGGEGSWREARNPAWHSRTIEILVATIFPLSNVPFCRIFHRIFLPLSKTLFDKSCFFAGDIPTKFFSLWLLFNLFVKCWSRSVLLLVFRIFSAFILAEVGAK